VLNGAVDPHEDGLPKPTPEMKLIAAALGAHLQGLPPKKRARFLERMGRNLEAGADHAGITRIRRSKHEQDEAAATLRALAWWRSNAGVLAMIGED
jgi:hypothetical protein